MARNEGSFTDLTLAYRAHFVRSEARERGVRLVAQGWPATVLVFDTETTIDPTQQLTFGAFAYGRWTDGTITVVSRGLFYADDLPQRDPKGFAELRAYQRAANLASPVELELMSRREFADAVLWKAYLAGALLCGFNLPFDMSRIAIDCGEGRGFYYGGFSIPIWDYDAGGGQRRWHPYRPRLNAKPIDSKRAFLGLSGTKEPQAGMHRDDVRGHLLDLKSLAFALTAEPHSLASASKAFNAIHQKYEVAEHGVITAEYIAYNLQDVHASLALLERLRAEFDRHPITLDPTRALSPAAMAKAYLRAMNVTPPILKFGDVADEKLGYAMTAYYGGRAEARIRHQIAPVVMLDVLSMYPTVNTLFGNWDLLTAERLDIEDATDDLRALLDRVTPDQVFEPAFWRELRIFAEIDAVGDVLPTRARYGDGDEFSIGVNEVHAMGAWYAAPDLVASKLLTGRAPRIRRAYRLVPRGRQDGLRDVALGGHTIVNPASDDFFKLVIEARKRAKSDATLPEAERRRLDRFFKVLANAGGYGIFAEINPQTLPLGETAAMRLFGHHDAYDVKTRWPEDGGEFFFPPLAALITAGARLVLALLERCVTDLGGTYAFCDTDSMAIVATCEGGPVSAEANANTHRRKRIPTLVALSYEQVDAIVARFEQLNPYDRAIIPGSILKVEDENFDVADRTQRRELFALTISAKRYALFNLDASGDVVIRKASEHGLGHLIDPMRIKERSSAGGKAPAWIREVWHYLIQRARGRRTRRPPWFKLPAVSRIAVTTPELLARFGGTRRDRWYRDRVKPFNFVISAHVLHFGQGEDPATGELFDASTFHLLAPYTDKPNEWLQAEWFDRATGRRVPISTSANLSEAGVARVQSYGDVVDRYWVHAEAKSAAPDGAPCEARTSGLLTRRTVRRARYVYVSKEARKLEEVQHGQVHQWTEVQDVFVDDEAEWVNELSPRLRKMKRADAANRLGISERAVTELRQGRSRPSDETRRALRQLSPSGRKA